MPSLEPFLSWLMNALAAIPATFWGVVVGSFFTLLAGYVTNRATDRRQRAQFDHDQGVKRDERELALRKDIYLAAIEAIQEGGNALGNVANLEISHGDLTKAYINKASAVAKVQVVARVETLRAVMEAASFITAALFRLATRRMPLDTEKQQLTVLQSIVAGFESERDKWLEEMKRYNLAGVPNERLWDNLQKNYKFEDQRISEMHAVIAGRTLALATLQLDLAEAGLVEGRQLATVLVPAVLAVRSELNIASDEPEIRKLMGELLAKQQVASDKFLGETREILANLNSGSSQPAGC